MKEEKKIESLATKYGLPIEFVQGLFDKIVDKENFERALRMFNDGTLMYEEAIGKEPINIGDIRRKLASNFREIRAKFNAQMEQERNIIEYYNGCTMLKHHHKKANKAVQEVVFIKDGHLVAFAHFEPKKGGIYAANNEVMPNFRWNPHEHLARLRKLNKAFYRQVKKAAHQDPQELFDFSFKNDG